MSTTLSKSKYCTGLQCPKLLYESVGLKINRCYIMHITNQKALIIESCPNLVLLEGLKAPKLATLGIKRCGSITDYAPLNEITTRENLTTHTKHPTLNALRRAKRPNLTLFVTVEDENGSYQKCFRAEMDFLTPALDNFLGEST